MARIKNAGSNTNTVLETLAYSRASDLSKRQAKLTAAATQLSELLQGPLSTLLNEEETKVIREANLIVSSLSQRVQHAKEIRNRVEKRKAADLLQRGKVINLVLDNAFMAASPVAEEAREQIFRAVILMLYLHEESAYLDFYSMEEVEADTLRFVTQRLSHSTLQNLADNLQWEIKNAMRDSIERRPEIDPHATVTSWMRGLDTNASRIAKAHECVMAQIRELITNHNAAAAN